MDVKQVGEGQGREEIIHLGLSSLVEKNATITIKLPKNATKVMAHSIIM